MTEIVVNVGGIDYTWYRYDEPLEILNASDINNAVSNAKVIHTALTKKGYTLNEFKENFADYSTQYVDIVDKLNNVEYNLNILNNPTIMSIFYGEPVWKYAGETGHNKEEIWRWFQILEDMLEIVQGLKGKWGYLLCNNGYPTINGKRLVVRGDLIG